MHARAHVLVKGRVQGVFFRASIQREALKRRVVGWVRNLSDGRVEAVFEGERKKIGEIIDFCGKGPSLAIVTEVNVSWEEASGRYVTFSII